ncbi:MAG TPA: 2Fe-2S iron-sulfur cluster-binding protein, partial [Solirubrobacteraceae bacterium]
MSRLPAQPGERLDRSKTIGFSFDGKRVEALAGDTIASALFVAGQRTFSRSFKYHRRRGLLCCAGQCPNCLVAVDGAPGVRACTEPVREGMAVEHLNASPSLEHDAMAVTDTVGGPFTPPGFYYKTFIRPRRLWPVYEKVLRHAAGLGKLRASQDEREWRTEYRRRHADVLVVGGGLAGLRAALAAAEAGADVVLADEGPEPGGRALAEGGHARARELAEQARSAGVEVLSSASVLGSFDGLVPIWQASTLHQVRARQLVFATGVVEQPLVFAGNDLPGVMLSGGVRRLIALYGIAPGTRAVIATTSDRGLEAARALEAAGVEVVAVADLREGRTILEAEGRKHVRAAILGGLNGSDERRFECDLVVVSGGVAPATSLVAQAGGRTAYDEARGHFAIAELPDGVLAAGAVAGAGDDPEPSGARAGAQAAHALGLGDAPPSSTGGPPERRAPEAVPPAVAGAERGKCFACLCEDVTAKDIHLSVDEGYDSIELSKRYTTTTMGPCQGRMCQLPAVRLMAQETGQDLARVGTTTPRPPWSAVPLGALAGRPFEPAKRSAIHPRHRALGARVMWAGDWRRAYDYGDPQGEALAVHEAAGLIDVSTLGKLIVRGPEAGAFLDRLYPNRFANLQPGRIRYGVLTSDAGRIMDDGTICRLDDDSFYVTTTSSGAGAVEQWFSWWLADWRMQVALTDVTQGLAAVNLAGPRAREIMGRLTDLDCSNEAFSYLDAKRAPVAGVP